jgi:hypothetical protein
MQVINARFCTQGYYLRHHSAAPPMDVIGFTFANFLLPNPRSFCRFLWRFQVIKTIQVELGKGAEVRQLMIKLVVVDLQHVLLVNARHM